MFLIDRTAKLFWIQKHKKHKINNFNYYNTIVKCCLILITGLTGAQPAKPVLKPVGLTGLSDKIPDQNGHSTTTATTTPVKKVTFLWEGCMFWETEGVICFHAKFQAFTASVVK